MESKPFEFLGFQITYLHRMHRTLPSSYVNYVFEVLRGHARNQE